MPIKSTDAPKGSIAAYFCSIGCALPAATWAISRGYTGKNYRDTISIIKSHRQATVEIETDRVRDT